MRLFNFVAWTSILVLVAVFVQPAHAEAVVKKVCHEEKGKQVCKNIKTHQKVEGTPVPEKAPAAAKNPTKK
jgi:hypothetical protein